MQSETTAIFAVMLTGSVILVGIRLYVRLFVQADKKLGVDDWIIVSALILWTAASLCVLLGAIPQGLGRYPYILHILEALKLHP